MYSIDTDVGYVMSPEFQGTLKRAEFEMSFSSSREGLRGGDLEPRLANTIRFLVLGDSQVWGYGVQDQETLTHELEILLADRFPSLDFQVLNAGVPGYGTADELNFLRSRQEALDPDVVILVFLPVNDFDENRVPATTWADVQDGYLTWGNDQSETKLQKSPTRRLKAWLKKNSHLARFLSDTLGYIAMRGGMVRWMGFLWRTGEEFTEQDAEQTRELLQAVAGTATERGALPLFVYSTGQDRVLAREYQPTHSLAIVQEAAESTGSDWIDVTPYLRSRQDRLQLFYPQDGHWTARGHSAVAQLLFDHLVETGTVEAIAATR